LIEPLISHVIESALADAENAHMSPIADISTVSRDILPNLIFITPLLR
jgi:hypothetical protein